MGVCGLGGLGGKRRNRSSWTGKGDRVEELQIFVYMCEYNMYVVLVLSLNTKMHYRYVYKLSEFTCSH